ncbi:hypothetical protein [Tropicibacter sp. S64]|uniref:hypothetical protein n=1 Tax=Tropicibacter sp. S64 TaxID=3415122 RepID=UPI003C7A9B00
MSEEIEIGQFWAVPASAAAPPLLVGVFSIDEDGNGGTVVGVFVQPHPQAQESGWPTVDHMPLNAETLGLVHARLVRSGASAGTRFEEGYGQWARAFADGKAGVFSIPVSEAYAMVAGVAENKDVR